MPTNVFILSLEKSNYSLRQLPQYRHLIINPLRPISGAAQFGHDALTYTISVGFGGGVGDRTFCFGDCRTAGFGGGSDLNPPKIKENSNDPHHGASIINQKIKQNSINIIYLAPSLIM